MHSNRPNDQRVRSITTVGTMPRPGYVSLIRSQNEVARFANNPYYGLRPDEIARLQTREHSVSGRPIVRRARAVAALQRPSGTRA